MTIDAAALHADALVIDAHSDVFADVANRRAAGKTSYLSERHMPDWKAGGVNAVVTTLYTEPEFKPDRATRRALAQLGAALNDIDETPDAFLCQSAEEVESIVADGSIAFILAMEGAEPIQLEIGSLRVFYELGLRILGLTWNQRNLLAEGVGEDRAGGGITERGREYIAECNRLGILLDVSHLTVKSFWDLMESSEGPVIASHSNALALCSHKRNLDDDQIKALAERGGIIGINGVAGFIHDDPEQANLDGMLDHLDYIASLVGVRHVALGPDFVDYMRDDPASFASAGEIPYPDGFENITRMPNVTAGLVSRGYSEEDIRGILGLNFLRVFGEVCG
ncbi:MAG: dipeptidase [Thermomicrobiales bacterium]